MTPYEKAGFDDKSLFITQNWASGYANGQIVHLDHDDGSKNPFFRNADGEASCQYINEQIRELPRDQDGYYIWEGGEQPVPDDWVVESKGGFGRGQYPARNEVWSDITAFRVISTGDKASAPEQEDWCKVGAKVCIGNNPKVHEILKIDEDKGCFLGCGLWKCRTELEPYNVTESEQVPEGATVCEPALIGWQEDLDNVDLEITLTKELFISLAMDAHLCSISLNEHLVNIIKGEYK